MITVGIGKDIAIHYKIYIVSRIPSVESSIKFKHRTIHFFYPILDRNTITHHRNIDTE